MSTIEVLNLIALVFGPLIGIQITRWLDDRKEVRDRKLAVFKTLMETRAYNTSWEHVGALNRIDLEFDKRKPGEKKVLDAWKAYLDLLGTKGMSPEQWNIRRVDLLVKLLHEMAAVLNYDFDEVTIKNSAYSPISHGKLEDQQETIRNGVIELLEGKKSLSVRNVV